MTRRFCFQLVAAMVGLVAAAAVSAAETGPPRLFLIGGSTMATFPETRPVVGWGQKLPQFFKDPAQVDNRAKSGRSTKSFIDQGFWDAAIKDIRAGDFLIMCWGTNDSSVDVARHTEPRGEFLTNLRRFIRETRAKGATPILATQVAHRRWNDRGEFVEPTSDYVVVTREVAVAERVPLMEMFERTVALERKLGVKGSIALHLYLEPEKYPDYPKGAKDDTHYNAHGASQVAMLAVEELKRLQLPIVAWLKDDAAVR